MGHDHRIINLTQRSVIDPIDIDQAWPPYEPSHGKKRQLLAEIALRPKAKWFGAWIPDSQMRSGVSAYLTNAQAGDPPNPLCR